MEGIAMGIETLGAYQMDNARFDVDRLKKLGAEGGGGNQPEGNARFSELLANPADKDAAAAGASRIAGVPGASIDKDGKLYDTCRELETFFLKMLISGLRKTVEKSELSQTGFAGEMYEDMLYDEYAKDFARNSGFGFADLAYLELTGQRGKAINRSM
jgi:flagellar protein FlgJ